MINIAIDGPSGAGKSTIAKALAQKLGYMYVDTGAMYRLIALFDSLDWKLERDIAPEDIRSPEVSQLASKLSALPDVRAFLLERQRAIASRRDTVLDGRDIGTVVLPEARVKIFLTASPQARARRRTDELAAKGVYCFYEQTLREILERDERDTTRAAAPLKQAEDAVVLDTTHLTLDESIAAAIGIVESRL
ncbi:cytidylate kinase [Clostridia bacterium]|nr:cytidylate kinase [Clostridia bacterium]GHV37463.1 cytidylate kinase [Clostridia bacterium]